MLRIGAIVQVRMSSRRLPGKVLKNVNGKPLLQYVLEKLEHCSSLKEFVVATSLEKSDDPIEAFCKKYNVSYYRGSLNDVASRFKEVSERNQWNAFVRVNGDSPLIDSCLIDKGIDLYGDGNFDLVTNIFPRTYPSGQSIEVVRVSTFKNVYSRFSNSDDFEHVTNFFYRNPQEYKIFNFSSKTDYGKIHMSVDTPEDIQLFSTIISKMIKPHWEYRIDELIKLVRDI